MPGVLTAARGAAGAWILSAPAGAARNMALDETLLERAAGGGAALRVYRWARPAISIGYAQPLRSVPRPAGRAMVRRPTGGGAVLHGDDVCFALALPAPSLGRLRPTLRAVAEATAAALGALGARARVRGGVAHNGRHPLCDARTGPFDVIDPRGPRKVAGLAARRRAEGLLVQSSVRTRPAARRGMARVLAEALAAALGASLGVRLRAGALEPAERAHARALERTRYGTRAWLARR